MSEDRSLDEFAGGSEGDADDEADESSEGDADDEADEVADDGELVEEPEPATSTSAWAGEGSACDTCGTVTERRWEDDDELVCADCKSW